MIPVFSRLNLWMCFAISLTALGCSKNSSPSSVQLQFPDWNEMRQADLARQSKVSTLAFDATKVSMLVVNITGADLKTPVFFSWENHDDTQAVPPSAINLEVTRGKDRLIQVLAVYNGDSGMSFYYADATANFESENVPVALELTNAASGPSAMEGHIVGRYIDANGKGPTGEYEYRYSPVNKPSMVVHHGEIFGGWGRFFALNSPILTYRMKKDGTELFPGRHNSSPEFFSSSKPERAMRVAVPAGYEERSGGTLFAAPARREVLGFFGPGADGKRICYSASTVEINGLYVDEAKTTKMKFYSGSGAAPSTRYAYAESVTLASGTQVRGGSSSASCQSSGTEWDDYIVLNGTQLAYGESLRFKGPFRPPSGDQQGFVKTTLSSTGTSLNVAWELLPGADDDIGGYGVFYRQRAESSGSSYSDSDIRADDGFRCNELKSLKTNPFKEIFVSDKAARSADIPDVSASSVGNMQIVICPYSNSLKRYYSSAVVAYGVGGGSCSSCGGSTGPSQLLTMYQANHPQRNAQAAGDCVAYKIKLTDFNGALKTASSAMSINVGHSSPNSLHHFYSSEGCSGSGATSYAATIAAGSSETERFYYRAATSGYYSLTAYVNNSTSTMESWFQLGVTNGNTAPTEMQIYGPSKLAPHLCYHYTLELRATGSPAADSTAREVALAISGMSGAFYTDSNCSVAAANNKVTIPALNYMTSVYFKPTGSPATGALTANVAATTATASLVATLEPAPQLGDSTLAKYIVASYSSDNYFVSGQCKEVYIRPTNSIGASIQPSVQKNLTVSIANGQIYTNPSCSAGSLAGSTYALTFYSYQTTSMSFYIQNDSSSTAMTLSVTDGTGGITTADQNFVEAPPTGFRVSNTDDSDLGTFSKYICKQIKLTSIGESGDPYSRTASYEIAVTAQLSGTAIPVYTDSTCSTPLSNSAPHIVMPSASANTSFYVRPMTLGTLYFDLQYADDSRISNHFGGYSVLYQ